MSDTDTTTDDGATISGDAGFERLADQAAADEREQRKRLTEAEKQKQRIMRERSASEDGEPVTVHVDDYQFVFDPLPKKVRVWVENSSFEFLGFDEDELENDPERGKQFRDVRDRTVEILAEHSQAAAYDTEFWREWFGLEERMGIINDVLAAVDQRPGN